MAKYDKMLYLSKKHKSSKVSALTGEAQCQATPNMIFLVEKFEVVLVFERRKWATA